MSKLFTLSVLCLGLLLSFRAGYGESPITRKSVVDLPKNKLIPLLNVINQESTSWHVLSSPNCNEITEPGVYRILSNTNAHITVDADNVLIDLHGSTLTCLDYPVITIYPGHTNIEISNGNIKGAGSDGGYDGILTSTGCSLINLKNLKIYSCNYAIAFAGDIGNSMIEACKVQNCEFEDCVLGTFLNYTKNMVFENCQAFDCLRGGFSQLNSNFNVFDNCSAIETANGDPNDFAVGFASTSGTGNLFRRCVTEGTTKSYSNFDCNAYGFLLTGTEGAMEHETKIINCIANSSLIQTGTGIAYGMCIAPVLLHGTLDDLLLFES